MIKSPIMLHQSVRAILFSRSNTRNFLTLLRIGDGTDSNPVFGFGNHLLPRSLGFGRVTAEPVDVFDYACLLPQLLRLFG